jgi:hypothetical protein
LFLLSLLGPNPSGFFGLVFLVGLVLIPRFFAKSASRVFMRIFNREVGLRESALAYPLIRDAGREGWFVGNPRLRGWASWANLLRGMFAFEDRVGR